MAVAWLALGASPAAAQIARERKNIDDLTPQELAAYLHAIDVLKNRNDPTNNYSYHANLHNLFVISPPHGCEHGNDLFFPWHRWHLVNFEKSLQASDPDHPTLSTKNVTIPYWNWTKRASGKRYPNAFEDPKYPVLYNEFRNTAASDPSYDEAYMTRIVRGNPDWNAFAGGPKSYGALEIDSHNTMHSNYIGDLMARPSTAAEDPIYWSFHAFIDMQWDRWQKIYKKPPTSQEKVLRGFRGSPKVTDTVDVTKLGYFYTHPPGSTDPPMRAAPPRLEARVLELPTALAGVENLVAVWGGAGPFCFKLADPKEFHRAQLWLEGVRIPATYSYTVEVFIHQSEKKYRRSDLAGAFCVWQGHWTVDGKPHEHTGNVFLDVTDRLRKEGVAKGEYVVTLVPSKVVPKARLKAVAPTMRPEVEEIQFRAVYVTLDGAPPPHTNLKAGGKHGH